MPLNEGSKDLHNRVFSGESKWELVVNSAQDTEAASPSPLSQGNVVPLIVIVPKNQII